MPLKILEENALYLEQGVFGHNWQQPYKNNYMTLKGFKLSEVCHYLMPFAKFTKENYLYKKKKVHQGKFYSYVWSISIVNSAFRIDECDIPSFRAHLVGPK